MMEDFEKLCRKLEHFETPLWAAEEILKKEIITKMVVDPCCGSGILSEAAKKHARIVLSFDIHNWGYFGTTLVDYLADTTGGFPDSTCFMNPPFSKATKFVEKAVAQNFRKIICFQRFAWYESSGRREFWEKFPPSRVYICGDRASCWRHDIPKENRGSGTPTAHAWFVWDRNAPSGTILDRIYKAR